MITTRDTPQRIEIEFALRSTKYPGTGYASISRFEHTPGRFIWQLVVDGDASERLAIATGGNVPYPGAWLDRVFSSTEDAMQFLLTLEQHGPGVVAAMYGVDKSDHRT